MQKKPRFYTDNNWRVCAMCNEYKTRDDFPRDTSSKIWYRSKCKDCRSVYYKNMYRKYRESHKEIRNNILKQYKPALTSNIIPTITYDDTVCDAVQEVIDRIWLLPQTEESDE